MRPVARELGASATPVRWDARRGAGGGRAAGRRCGSSPDDWLFTAELFCEDRSVRASGVSCGAAVPAGAMFADAIPLRHPQITWPQSVARHPEYMKMLAAFDRVWAISEASRRDLVEFWRWQGGPVRAAVGDDHARGGFRPAAAVTPPSDPPAAQLLCVGILEPRKNQMFLLDVCEALWAEGVDFELHLVGRVNPHFGRPVAARLKAMRKPSRGCITTRPHPTRS
jgi:glycosyltransferase involved in cell wall biosynthesis